MTRAEEIAAAFSSDDPEQRRRAIESLREHRSEVTMPAGYVLRALGDDDWRVRKQAVEVAIALSPAPDLLEGLVDALLPGDNVGLRNAAVEALGAYGEFAVDALLSRYGLLDADGRKLAAEALGRTALPSALRALKPMISDQDENVQAAAVDAIATVGTAAVSEAFTMLAGFLHESGGPVFVRLCALDGINRLGSLLPWQTIASMLEDPVLERSALVAAGRSAHPEALAALLAAFERARGTAQSAVLGALLEYVRAFSHNQPLLRAQAPAFAVERSLLELSLPSNRDLASRKAALIVAGALGLEPIAELAAEALSDLRLLAEADEALNLLGPRAVPALLARAARADPEVCAACIEIITNVADESAAPAAVRQICSWLSSAPPIVVRAGLGALTLLGDASCFAAVLAWLGDPDTASSAETALAALAERYPREARALAQSAGAHGREAHAAAIIQAAIEAPIRATLAVDVTYLSLLLSSSDKALRRAALAGLGQVGSHLGTDAAVFALTDEEPEVRQAAVLALSRLRDADGALSGLPKLLELVEKSTDQELLAATLAALGQAGDARVLSVLRPLLRSASPMVAVAAIEALARVPDPRRIEVLIEALSHPESEVVKASLLALDAIVDPRVLAHFGVCLEHEAWDVRRLSADMLGCMGGEAASALLRARSAREKNPLVQEAIARALEGGGGFRHTPLLPRAGSLRPR